MTNLTPPLECNLFRLEALEGPTDFHLQFSCHAGVASDHFGLRGSDFQINSSLYTVVAIDTTTQVHRILGFRSSAGFAVDDEAFLRAFASSILDMLERDGAIFEKKVFVVVSGEAKGTLITVPQASDQSAPSPFDQSTVLDQRAFKSVDSIASIAH
jgi:hypothetical protein